MARKVFISFLGSGKYGSCHYCKDGFKSLLGRYVQEATLDYLQSLESWTQEDAAYILLTDGAYNKNWLHDEHEDRDTHEIIHQSGLKSVLTARNYPFTIYPVEHLPDGNNEAEIFEIFSRVFDLLQDGDRLYFDITHGFRYLPMLVLVLQNYAKFLKDIKVEAITYGNFETRNKETNEAQIIDLLPLSNIQDWTFAAADYLENGNAGRIKDLVDINKFNLSDSSVEQITEIAQNLELTSKDFQTCRLQNIIYTTNIDKLRKSISGLGVLNLHDNSLRTLTLLMPLLNKANDIYVNFNKNGGFENGLLAAKWCMNHKLYQQAETILQETILTYFCQKNGFDIIDTKKRNLISTCLNICLNKTIDKENKWAGTKVELEDLEIARLILKEMNTYSRECFIKPYGKLANDIRNDVNHGGMRLNCLSSEEFVTKLEDVVNNICTYLAEHD